MLKIIALLTLVLWPLKSMAIEEQPIYSTEVFSLDEIVGQMSNFTSTPEGGIDWEIFSQTKNVPYKIKKDDQEWEGVKPDFTDEIKKLDGTSIKMTGYMFPLDQTEEQSLFLFGPFPLTCPYHYHTPNSLTIEAHANKPIKFSYEPITIEGTLELVPQDYEYNTFYRLNNVKVDQ
jgi:hypothetical protein